jgi:hypothetical protein
MSSAYAYVPPVISSTITIIVHRDHICCAAGWAANHSLAGGRILDLAELCIWRTQCTKADCDA